MELIDITSFLDRAHRAGKVAQVKLACSPGFEPIRAIESYADWVMLHGPDLETEIIVPFSQIEALRMDLPRPEGSP